MAEVIWHECAVCGKKLQCDGGNCPQCGATLTAMPPLPPGFHRCPKCGTSVPDERRDLLGIEECPACTPQKRPPKGVWDYPEGFHERNEGVGGLIVLD